MNRTTDYYNRTTEQYFRSTKDVDFTEIYERFLKYVPKGGHIIDVGCGSGRDVVAFIRRGYLAEGIDTSEELTRYARENFGIRVTTCDMVNWQFRNNSLPFNNNYHNKMNSAVHLAAICDMINVILHIL